MTMSLNGMKSRAVGVSPLPSLRSEGREPLNRVPCETALSSVTPRPATASYVQDKTPSSTASLCTATPKPGPLSLCGSHNTKRAPRRCLRAGTGRPLPPQWGDLEVVASYSHFNKKQLERKPEPKVVLPHGLSRNEKSKAFPLVGGRT